MSDVLLILILNAALWLWVWLVPTLVLPCPWLPDTILGLALPGVILVRPSAFTVHLLRHELTHIRQMRRWSPLGTWLIQFWNYALRPWWILARQRHWPGLRELYHANPLEREAFRAMEGGEALLRTWGVRPLGGI